MLNTTISVSGNPNTEVTMTTLTLLRTILFAAKANLICKGYRVRIRRAR